MKHSLFNTVKILTFFEITSSIFTVLFFVDCFILGSGNILKIPVTSTWGISSRMILFFLSSLTILIVLLVKKDIPQIKNMLFVFLMCFLFVLLLSFIYGGKINGFYYAWVDFQPFIAFSFLFFVFFTNYFTKKTYGTIILLFKICSICISVFCLFVYFSTFFTDSVYDFFHNLLPRYEIIRRKTGGGIYVPGQIVVFISIIICWANLLIKRKNIVIDLVCLFAGVLCILQVATRSFIIPIALAFVGGLGFLIFQAVKKKDKHTIITLAILFSLLLLLVLLCIFVFDMSRIFSQIEEGTEKRIAYIKEVFNNITFFGKGFGYALASTGTGDLETSLLEILLEQGIFGLIITLCFLSFLCLKIWKYHCRIYNIFAICCLILFVLSDVFNPYVFNPIGMSMISIIFLSSKYEFFCPKICSKT